MITAVFKEGSDHANAAGLTQWDYGQVLRIQGLKLPAAVEVHFSLQQVGGEAVTRIGVTRDGVTDVVIPDSMLEADKAQNYCIYAWVYLRDSDSGETIKSMSLAVKARSKPEAFESPEDAELFQEAIAAVNDSAERAEAAGKSAAEYAGQAQASAEEAASSAEAAAQSASAAQFSADAAAGSATQASEYKAQAQSAATNALQSEQAAKTAQSSAEAARTGAETAEDQARQYAEEAADNRATVVQKAQEVESARAEVASNKAAVNMAVEEFTGTTQAAIQDVTSAGTAQVQSIETAGSSQVQAVQAEGLAQIANVQAAAAEIEADREQIGKNKALAGSSAPGIVQEAEGTAIVLTDSSDRPFQGLMVFGRTTQETTTGAQLYPENSFVSSYAGYPTMEGNDEGKITINGTASVEGGRNTIKSPSFLLNAGTYSVSYYGIKECGVYLVNENDKTNLSTTGNETFSLEEEASVHFGINAKAGITYNDEFYIMLNAGSTALPWEPYTGGQPSPNPDYPQELVSAGDDGNVEIVVGGSQLLYLPDIEKEVKGVTIKIKNGVMTLNGTPASSGGRTTYLSDTFTVKANTTYILFANTDNVKGYLTNILDETEYFVNGFTPVKDMEVRFGVNINEGVTYKNVTLYPMLNYGLTALPWEPYRIPQSLSLSTPNGLPGIPVSSGGNYTDEDGQQWVCDEIDLARGVYVQRVMLYLLTSDLNWNIYNLGLYIIGGLQNVSYDYRFFVLCSHYRYGRNDVDPYLFWTSTSGSYSPIFHNTGFETIEEWKAWLDKNELKFMYILDTSIETPIPADELAAYQELHTNYPTTTIISNQAAHMAVSYIADTETYISNEHTKMREEFEEKLAEILSRLPAETQAAMIEADTQNLIAESEV